MANRDELLHVGFPAEQVKALFSPAYASASGDVTLNAPMGQVILAAAASSLTLTNSHIKTGSKVFLTLATNDATVTKVRASSITNGSCTISGQTTATADTRINFWVIG